MFHCTVWLAMGELRERFPFNLWSMPHWINAFLSIIAEHCRWTCWVHNWWPSKYYSLLAICFFLFCLFRHAQWTDCFIKSLPADWFQSVMWPISCWSIHCSEHRCTFTADHIFNRLTPKNASLIGKTNFHSTFNLEFELTLQHLCSFVFHIKCSLLGSSLFSLGSVLVWAIIRSSVPRNVALGTAIGLATSYGIARLSYDYLQHVDGVASKKAIESS